MKKFCTTHHKDKHYYALFQIFILTNHITFMLYNPQFLQKKISKKYIFKIRNLLIFKILEKFFAIAAAKRFCGYRGVWVNTFVV